MKNCTINYTTFLKVTNVYKIFALLIYFSYMTLAVSQEITLDYIFQEPAIINPRPSLKFISSRHNKIYYYADPDYNGTLELFEYDYSSGEYYKFPDSIISPSEFLITNEGDAFFITESDIYFAKDFASKRTFTKDTRFTNTEEYEYSIQYNGDMIIYRRSGNYFAKPLNNPEAKEIQITTDESERISNFPITYSGYSDNSNKLGRIFIARYDDSLKENLLIPDYTNEKIKIKTQKRGRALVRLFEIEVNYNDSLFLRKNEIIIPEKKEFTILSADYSPDNKTLIFDTETIGSRNRKIYSLDLMSFKLKEIYSESDSAWFEHHSNPIMFINNEEFIFESEANGFNNIYKLKTDGSALRQIAGGNFHVKEFKADITNKKIYFIANIRVSYQYDIYETDFEGYKITQLTTDEGIFENVKFSTDSKYLFYEYSCFNHPSEIYYINKPEAVSKQITNTISSEFTSIEWMKPELISFLNEEDSTKMYGYFYKPKNYSKKKKYPLICFAHGGAYLQLVTNGFPLYQNNFMFNTILTSLGYAVLEIDYRGSEGYGKDFRTKTFGNLGYWEMSDFISGINYVDKTGIIDKNKIGIYGASYGGFLSLMSAFRYQDYFKTAISVKGISDWRIHNQSNRWFTYSHLGDFDEEKNKINYKISSPITYAENLNIPLMIFHGMLDDNVLFQDMVLLTQKLIDHKKDFEIMIYPKESHTFYRQTSLLNEYKRILNFFERNLK